MENKIREISTEQLFAEIERRKTKEENLSSLYIGIIDSEGAESLIKTETFEKFSPLISQLQLRARFNGQRRPIVYSVHISQSEYEIFNKRLLAGDYIEVGNELKELLTFTRIGY